MRYGYTSDGQFTQGQPPEGKQAAVSTIESPWERQIRQTLQPASVDLVGRMVDDNVSNMPGPARVQDRGDVAATIFDRNFSLMAPAIDKSNEKLIQNLQARGLPVGGEAFNDAYGEQLTRTQDTIGRMAMDADIAAGQEQSRLYGLDANERATALSEIATLMGGSYNPPSAVPSGNTAGINFSGMVNNQYNAQMEQYQQAQQQKMATASTIGQIGVGLMKCTMEAKEVAGPLNTDWAADVVKRLPLDVWSYTPEGAPEGRGTEPHIGPMAEHFKALTGLGSGKDIDPIDYLGLMAGALQAALLRIEVLEREQRSERLN